MKRTGDQTKKINTNHDRRDRECAKLIRRLMSTDISIPVIPRSALVEDACADYNMIRDPRSQAVYPNVRRCVLDSVVVNYIRHRHTPYDRMMETAMRSGFDNMYERPVFDAINVRVYGAIAAAYPILQRECVSQLQRKNISCCLD